MFYIGINCIGLICNITLYVTDIKTYGSVLNNVDKGNRLTELMTSPAANKSRKDIIKESMKGSRNS